MENDFNDFTKKEEMSTLASCMNNLRTDGFTDSFAVKADGLGTADSDRTYKPEEVHIVNFYRFEGESDPADNSILYAIETNDGKKGVLTDAYGPYADAKVSKFIKEVEDIMKKTTHEEKI